LSITLLIRDARWRKVRGLGTRMKHAVFEALVQGGAGPDADVTVLLTTDRHIKALNRNFRGKDTATNVLSFPAGSSLYLGDVAIAYGVASREAKAEGKKLDDHAVHLAVHGVLHLMGFDHVTALQARIMEPLEARILGMLSIADPYQRETA
jgi:probable rRNA maturation factor